jgi:hypothetical protein
LTDLYARTKALVESVDDLHAAVDDLTERWAESEAAAAKARKSAAWSQAVLVVLVVVSAALALLAWTSFDTAQRLDVEVQRNEVVTQQSLCPLFNLIVGSYRPESRPAGPERDAYEQAFVQLRTARDQLACREGLVPPSQPS